MVAIANACTSAQVASEPQAVYGVFGGGLRNFDLDQYLANNADLRPDYSNIGAATTHYAHHGWREGRTWWIPGTPAPDHLVIAAEAPEQYVLDGWKDAVHLGVALDDPVAIGRVITAGSSASRREAITRVTLSFSALHDRVLNAGTPFLSSAEPSNLAGQLAKLVGPIRISGAEGWLEHYLRHRMAKGWQDTLSGPQKASAPPDVEIFDPDNADLVAALEGYTSLLGRRPLTTVTWPSGMFHRPDAPLLSPAEPIDLSGPLRGILSGPHLCLPSGSWRCDATFTVSDNRRGCRFVVDVYQRGAVDRALSLYEFELPEQGTYTLQLHFEARDPYAPIENRYVLHEGLIGGSLQLHGVKLVRV